MMVPASPRRLTLAAAGRLRCALAAAVLARAVLACCCERTACSAWGYARRGRRRLLLCGARSLLARQRFDPLAGGGITSQTRLHERVVLCEQVDATAFGLAAAGLWRV